jgi:hypothetical protein
MRAIGAIAACVLLGACATIVEGRSQQIVVNTNPAGADCGLYRSGLRIATIQNTPGSTLIEKSKYDIWIACVKQGYQQATYYNHSGVAGATLGNIILGGGVGWIVDSATGSDNKYDSPVNITMVPVQPGQPAGPTTLPSNFEAVSPPSGQPPTSSPQTPQAPGAPQPTPGGFGPLTN